MKITHFFARSNNMGDLGSAEGVKKILYSRNPEIIFHDFDTEKKPSFKDREKIEKNNALIIGGGGLFYNRPRQVSNWNFPISFRKYSKLKCTKIIWGVGINAEYDKKERWNTSQKTEDSIYKYCKETHFIGVRDYKTLDFLNQMGIKNAEFVPCPSMFLLDNIPKKEQNELVGLNLTTRMMDFDKIEPIIHELKIYFEERGKNIIFISHHINEDIKVIKRIKKLGITAYTPSSPSDLMGVYKKLSLNIGTRGHSQIFSFGSNTPFIALSYNRKCDAFMEIINQDALLIKHNEFYNINKFLEKLDYLIKNKNEIQKDFKNLKNKFHQINMEFADRIIKQIEIHTS